MRILIGLLFALSATAANAARGVEVVVPPPAEGALIHPAGPVQPVSLARLAGNVRPGITWAEQQYGLVCVTLGTLQWKDGDNTIGADGGMERIFREELAKVGFRVSGDPTNLFEQSSKGSDLQVGALITDLRMRTCSPASNGAEKGVASMDVEWQVYSVSQDKILARIETKGGYEIRRSVPGGAGQLIGGAFTDNVRRLAASEQFRTLVSAPLESDKPPQRSLISFQPSNAAGQRTLADIAKSVVTVFAGDSLGSGVLISKEGYVLTNHHVVTDGLRVRIRWPDGAESPGEVLRSDRRRDVALIKVDPKAHSPVALRRSPAELGETVFAVGTPLDPALQGTLTKGIVSASRTIRGQTFIQSDVAVTHGNSGGPLLDERGAVIGLTDWVIEPNGASTNLNFFIPIGEALDVLGLTPVS